MAFNLNPRSWFSRESQGSSSQGTASSEPGNFGHNNPNYSAFNTIDADIAAIINTKPVIDRNVEKENQRYANPSFQLFYDNDTWAMPLSTNKNERISQYRRISKYLICDWCLDEICDDFLHEDENHNFINLKLPDRLNDEQQDILQSEFKKYMQLFNLQDNCYNYVKKFLVEGELAWENVINTKYPSLGIVGVRFLPAEYYETLVDTKTGQPVGLVFDTEKFSKDTREQYLASFNGAASVFNAISPMTYSFKFNKQTAIPLLWNQLTYINSGEFSYDNMTAYPLIEKAKQQYHRLALIEDAAIILRVTHAPERLLFNVSTGKMNPNIAEEYIRRFANELKSKKVATPDGKDAFGVYSSPTMLKSYVFGKSDGNDGTTVESVGSSANYDQMEDIEYFVRWFMKALKVPFSRYKTPENTMEKNDSISYEEYSFSRMIMRFHRRFAGGFKKSFITHLKLRNLWDKKGYELQESDINIEFVKPVLYDLYETQKLVDAKMSIYKSFKDNDEISKILVLTKILGWTDEQVKENFNLLIKEKQLIAIADYFAEQISPDNPPVDFKSPIKLKSDIDEMQKTFTGGSSGSEGGEESAEEGGESEEEGGDESGSEEAEEEEATPAKEPETPSFGLS